MNRELSRLSVTYRDEEVRCSKVLFARARRLLPPSWLLGLYLLSSVLCSLPSQVGAEVLESLNMPASPDGLSGGRYVGSAFGPNRALRLAGTLGFAYTGAVLDQGDKHQRLAGELYGGFIAWPSLQLSIGAELRYDHHKTRDSKDWGILAGTRITTRHAFRVNRHIGMAVEPSLWFPGAENLVRGFSSLRASLSGLLSVRASSAVSAHFLVGYRIDRSEEMVRYPFALSDNDRLAASIQRNNSTLLGAMATYATPELTGLVEWSWDVSAQGSVKAVQSPMRLRAAAQRTISERLLGSVELGVDVSQRPDFNQLVRIEPRFWARIGLVVQLDSILRKQPVQADLPPPVITFEPLLIPYTLELMDDAGQPITGARVVVARDGGQEHTSNEAGQVALQLPRGVTAVSIEKEGFESHWQTLQPGAAKRDRVVLSRSLPAAQIKGAVRGLAGEPVSAHVELAPLGVVVNTSSDGQFVINVAPGHYQLKISADGYEPQQRAVTVELRGVTILVIDLRRSHP